VELEKEEVQVQIDDIKRMYGSVNEHLEQVSITHYDKLIIYFMKSCYLFLYV